MAEGPRIEIVPGTEVRILFRNDAPIRADELGRVLTTLARDYKRATRATLAVTRLESGSVLAVLGAVATAAGNAEKIAKGTSGFVKALRSLLKPGPGGQPDQSQPAAPLQSAERILQLASDSRASVELEHVAADGSTTKLKITHAQVDEARIELVAQKLLEQRAQAPRLAAPEQRLLTSRAAEITDALLRNPTDDDAVGALVEALVAALGSTGGSSIFEDVAIRLEIAGRAELAARIRANVRRRRGEKTPLLLR